MKRFSKTIDFMGLFKGGEVLSQRLIYRADGKIRNNLYFRTIGQLKNFMLCLINNVK
jgi:hypothetical protein